MGGVNGVNGRCYDVPYNSTPNVFNVTCICPVKAFFGTSNSDDEDDAAENYGDEVLTVSDTRTDVCEEAPINSTCALVTGSYWKCVRAALCVRLLLEPSNHPPRIVSRAALVRSTQRALRRTRPSAAGAVVAAPCASPHSLPRDSLARRLATTTVPSTKRGGEHHRLAVRWRDVLQCNVAVQCTEYVEEQSVMPRRECPDAMCCTRM